MQHLSISVLCVWPGVIENKRVIKKRRSRRSRSKIIQPAIEFYSNTSVQVQVRVLVCVLKSEARSIRHIPSKCQVDI